MCEVMGGDRFLMCGSMPPLHSVSSYLHTTVARWSPSLKKAHQTSSACEAHLKGVKVAKG